jgi:transcription initiation factor TFIIIB Brf1 subunit/transcription initiation factor TFIIB
MSYRCPSCGSANVYYRVRRGEFICRRCGATWTVARVAEGSGEGGGSR